MGQSESIGIGTTMRGFTEVSIVGLLSYIDVALESLLNNIESFIRRLTIG
jgi:hypothetical protein